MPTFVSPVRAYQHLTTRFPKNLGETVTLCGVGIADIFEPVIHERKQGWDPNGGDACGKCAEADELIQRREQAK